MSAWIRSVTGRAYHFYLRVTCPWTTICEAALLLAPGRGCLRLSPERVVPILVRRAWAQSRSGEEKQYNYRAPPACCHQQRGDSGRGNTNMQPRLRPDPDRETCLQNLLGGLRQQIPARRYLGPRLSRRTSRWPQREFLSQFPRSSGSSFPEKHSRQLLHRARVVPHSGLDDFGNLST